MKRFYDRVAVTQIEDEPAGRYAIFLAQDAKESRAVRTPAKSVLWVPSRALADAIAAEWRAQTGLVELDSMDLTRVAASAIDRIVPRRDAAITDIAAYAGSDLVCYRAAGPRKLVKAQEEAWQPLVDWAGDTLGADLTVTTGVMPVGQSDACLAALARAVGAHADHELAALSLAAGAARSLVIALALVHDRLDANSAHAAAMLDEAYQAEHWGEEKDASARAQANLADLELAQTFCRLLRGG